MSAIEIILNTLMVISALVMIVTVLMQSSDDDGMGALTGGGSETFFGKNKNNTLEGKLANATKISAIVFVVLAILMLIVA